MGGAGMLMGLGRVLMSLARMFVRGRMVVPTMVFGGGAMRLRRVFVMLRGFGMGLFRHVLLLKYSLPRMGAKVDLVQR